MAVRKNHYCSLIIIMAMLLSMAGCAKNDEVTTDSSVDTETTIPSEDITDTSADTSESTGDVSVNESSVETSESEQTIETTEEIIDNSYQPVEVDYVITEVYYVMLDRYACEEELVAWHNAIDADSGESLSSMIDAIACSDEFVKDDSSEQRIQKANVLLFIDDAYLFLLGSHACGSELTSYLDSLYVSRSMTGIEFIEKVMDSKALYEKWSSIKGFDSALLNNLFVYLHECTPNFTFQSANQGKISADDILETIEYEDLITVVANATEDDTKDADNYVSFIDKCNELGIIPQ